MPSTARYAEYLKTNATPEELSRVLGPSWGVCRPTERNKERYARCITQREYLSAHKQAIALRANA